MDILSFSPWQNVDLWQKEIFVLLFCNYENHRLSLSNGLTQELLPLEATKPCTGERTGRELRDRVGEASQRGCQTKPSVSVRVVCVHVSTYTHYTPHTQEHFLSTLHVLLGTMLIPSTLCTLISSVKISIKGSSSYLFYFRESFSMIFFSYQDRIMTWNIIGYIFPHVVSK